MSANHCLTDPSRYCEHRRVSGICKDVLEVQTTHSTDSETEFDEDCQHPWMCFYPSINYYLLIIASLIKVTVSIFYVITNFNSLQLLNSQPKFSSSVL